jgi:dTDP-4-dehydrorhamnose reductase
MLERAAMGPATIRVSADVYTSPSYSLDVAVEVRRIMAAALPGGLYHVTNSGRTSLYDLMQEIVGHLKVPLAIERGSNADFPGVGEKNLDTALASDKLPPLRRWQDAVADYCRALRMSR